MKPFLLALVSSLLVAAAAVHAEPVPATVAPAWKLKDVNGKSVSFEQFKGKVVVIDFWATWCGPCRMEIPGYVELQKKYAKDGLVVIGVSIDEGGPKDVKSFIEKYGVDYRIVMGNEAVAKAFGGVEIIPTTFIIDRSGKIRDRKVGAEPTEEFEKRLLAILKP
jgi:thiol-disulfide isomerase/thioredoxin